ncbi:dihydrolipoamide dehydrogenase [Oceanicola granulosus HTCC2516]|uniref:Dihydrolipoamide dehydrogenase n=1 Tax=Oceanicola granulosus (strain ATCC BAA-861 / DSM 15982 / KCTC 12143 / HTCC2516) TaxID=314256 RepID=Q2CDX7_OCEGH|nr:dihydrolipoyl dehydrogenase [Oceanicola granulosus]EAR50851.1 dihydrolipoamide dehydrogenase [Oceanicola granulosus HTCC2516]
MITLTCDVAVIGAGTAGIAAESRARAAGVRTMLIDPAFEGTLCANVGCMPSKLLIAAAEAAHAVRGAHAFGVAATGEVDGVAVMARVRAWRDRFAQGVRDNLDELPEGVRVRGRARFVGETVLALEDGTRIEAGSVVIATGSEPMIPDSFDMVRDLVLTNRTVFELEDLPESLGVIGAGPVGVELAQAMARLGVAVTLFDGGTSIGGLPDETSAVLHDILSEEFTLHLGTRPEVSRAGDKVRLSHPGGSVEVARVLVAAGRPPALDGLDLAKAGLALDDHGTPLFDPETMRCGDSQVFLVGDANADRPVLHEASTEGTVAGYNAACCPETNAARRRVPMAVTFTSPAAAVVGRIPGEGDDIITGRVDFSDQGRAKVMHRAHGLCRIHAEPGTCRLLGADLCAPGGEHLAHLLAWAIQCGLTAAEVLQLPFYHPTLEEGLKTALKDVTRLGEDETPWDRERVPSPGT